MPQPQVPWFVAAAVGSAIALCGFVLVYNDPAFAIPPLAKFLIGCINAVLGVFGVYLNVKAKPE